MKRIRTVLPVVFVVCGVLCLIGAVTVYALDRSNAENGVEWYVTITGADGKQTVISYKEIKAMPSYEGWGGSFSTAGTVSGPYKVKGVRLENLCNLSGGVTPSQAVIVSAIDGYSMVYDYEQLQGEFDTYDPETMKVMEHDELELILMYEQSGKPLSQEYGKPLRIATAGTDKHLTEGHYWVKWVGTIEIMNID